MNRLYCKVTNTLSASALCCLMSAFTLALLSRPAPAQEEKPSTAAIFYTDRGTGKVHTSDPDGGSNKVLASIRSSNLRGIVADVPQGKVYFADNGTNKIYSVNLDGTGLKALVSGLGFPADLTMDRKARKLYWCDQQKSHIRRCNLDGSKAETVVKTSQPYYLDIDHEGGYITGALSIGKAASTGAKSTAEKSKPYSQPQPKA